MYRKVRPSDAGYELVKANQDAGLPVCDAWTHNSPNGCSNPRCWKYLSRRHVKQGQRK